MYFMLGNIALEAIVLTEFSETHAAEFAEHSVLKGKPQLQAMGEKLNELRFSIRLHHKIGGVESRYQALLNAKAEQKALALIWGRGKYKGNYVITDISSTTLFTDGEGNVLAREMNISLKEFVGDGDSGLFGDALNFGTNSLLGSILPAGVVQTLSDVKETITTCVETYHSGKRLVEEVQNTVAVVRGVMNDPAAALVYLPSVVNNLDGALGNFGEITGLSNVLNGVQELIPSAVKFSQEITEIYTDLQTMKSTFDDADNGGGWEDWLQSTESGLASINEHFDTLAKPVTDMTAWIVLREDDSMEQKNDDLS